MDAFLEACGAAGPLRLEIGGARLGRRRRTLARPFALIGRSSASDIRLGNPQISLRHAYFQLIQGRLACFDLGGRGGLRWDDGRPTRSGWLDPGRLVHIGPYTVKRLEVPSPGASDPAVVPPDPTPPLNLRWSGPGPDVTLVFPDESGGPVRWRMTRGVTLVGRAPSCRVRLPDESVSWYHCSLVRTPVGAWMVDLLSRGGVTVNGAPLRYARLQDGDELLIGRFRVVVRYGEVSGSIAHDERKQVPAATSGLGHPPEAALAQVDLPLEPELMGLLTSVQADVPSPALVMLVEQFGRMQQQMLEQFYQSTMALIGHLDESYRDQMRQMRDEMERLRALSQELVELRGQLSAPSPAPALEAPAVPRNGHASPASAVGPAPKRASGAAPPPPSPPRAPGPVVPPPPAPAADPLVMVSRRIAEIRGEQRSRWQKILDLVRAR